MREKRGNAKVQGWDELLRIGRPNPNTTIPGSIVWLCDHYGLNVQLGASIVGSHQPRAICVSPIAENELRKAVGVKSGLVPWDEARHGTRRRHGGPDRPPGYSAIDCDVEDTR